MELNIKRQRCQISFNRSPVTSIGNISDQEIHAVIDKVEAAADNFKFKRCFGKTMCIYFLILLLCIGGYAIRHHHQMMRGHRGGPRSFERAPGHFRGHSRLRERGPQREGSPMRHHGFQNRAEMGIPVFPSVPERRPEGPQRRHQQSAQSQNNPTPGQNIPTHTEVIPAVQENPTSETQIEENSSKPRSLQSIQSPRATTQSSEPTNPATIAGSAPTMPEPPVRHHGGRHYHHSPQWRWWMWRKHYGRSHRGSWMRGYHGRRHHHGRHHRHHGRHHRGHHRGHCFAKFLLFFFVIPGIICLIFRCKRMKVYRRVNRILEIENRMFAAKHGYQWSINKKITTLTLKKVAGTASLGYPAQPLYPQPQGVQTPFCNGHHAEAPMIDEQAPLASGRHQAIRGYERVSLDDSTVCYR